VLRLEIERLTSQLYFRQTCFQSTRRSSPFHEIRCRCFDAPGILPPGARRNLHLRSVGGFEGRLEFQLG
jgi:hypothetical protein